MVLCEVSAKLTDNKCTFVGSVVHMKVDFCQKCIFVGSVVHMKVDFCQKCSLGQNVLFD